MLPSVAPELSDRASRTNPSHPAPPRYPAHPPQYHQQQKTMPDTRRDAYHGNELRVGGELQLEANLTGVPSEVLLGDLADLSVVGQWRWAKGDDKKAVRR